MASSKPRTARIQMKHVLITLVGIFTTLLFIASIVLLSIGYMNPFGSVGLGILGGGCIVFFSAVLFFCASSIWIKNKYYPDEIDYGQTLVGRSSEDITLLKQPEVDWIKENEVQDTNINQAPLYSVSTVHSSVSSSFGVPENRQRDDAPGAMDSDVFSSSLTAQQDIKSQQQLKLNNHTSELAVSDSKVKDGRERQHAYISNFAIKSPQQQKPVPVNKLEDLPSLPYFAPHQNYDKRMDKLMNDDQIAITGESTTVRELCGRNAKLCSTENPLPTSAFKLKDCKGKQQKGKAVNDFLDSNQDRGLTQKKTQTDRRGFSIPDSAMQNTRENTESTGDLDIKNNSRQNVHKVNKDRSAIPVQYPLSQNQQVRQQQKIPRAKS